MKYFLILGLLFISNIYGKSDVDQTSTNSYFSNSLEDGREKKHILLLQVRSGSPNGESLKSIQKKAQWLESYWQYHARHKWNIQVEGFIMYTDCRPLAPNYCKTAVYNWMEENDLGDFDPNYFHLYGGYHESYCGQAGINANWGITYNPGICSVHTMAHELGHNFGWHHAGTLNISTGEEKEYGDISSIMGTTTYSTQGLLASQILSVNLNYNFNLIQETQQIIIAPPESHPIGLHKEEIQHHKIDSLSKYDKPTILSLRKRLGVPFPPEGLAQALFIHRQYTNKKTKLIQTIYPGTTYTLTNKVRIEYLEYTNERARVNVIMPEDTPPEDIEINSDWVLPSNTYISSEHSGVWYNSIFDGQGFDLQIKNNRAVIYWYTYNQGSIERRWYLGTCELSVCSEGFPLYTTQHGEFNNPILRTVTNIGQAQLYFTGTRTGVFSYNTTEHGRDAIPITAIALGTPDSISGSWYDPERDGAGLSIQKYDQQYVVYWFTYGPRDPHNWAAIENESQRWFIALGSSLNSLTVYETRTGQWMWPDDVSLVQVGTASIDHINNNLTFTYEIDAERIKASGLINMIRLF